MVALLIDTLVLALAASCVWLAQRLGRGLRCPTTADEAALVETWKTEARERAYPRC